MRFILAALLTSLLNTVSPAQSYDYIAPSAYTTFASYSDGKSSSDLSLYVSHNISPLWHGTANLGVLQVSDQGWSYPQYTAGYHAAYYYFPLTVKLDLQYLQGNFSYKQDKSYDYSDHTRLGGFDLLYYYNDMYFGASYTYLSANGVIGEDSLSGLHSHQAALRFVYIFSYDLSVTLRPAASILSDGRKLYSLYGRVNYQPAPEIILKAGGFTGERAYYYDTDLFVLFNQNATQKYQLFAQADYIFSPAYGFSLGYQHTKFNGFSINYYIAGIKTYFTI